MKIIVCAIRGGEASRPTQERAIQLAKESNGRLLYLYVVDVDNLGHLTPDEASAAQDELTWLAKVLLRMAQRRAVQDGVAAEIFISYGPVRQAIENFLKKEKVDLCLIGASRRETGRDIFPDGDVERFARSIEERTGIKTEVVQ